jgi:hypothetical protein
MSYLARRTAQVIVGFATFILFMLVPAQAASAIGPDCKDAPTPEMPGRGLSSLFLSNSQQSFTGPKVTPDGVPRFSQYGLAGMDWNNYDLGCGPDITRDPGAVITTMFGNWIFEPAKFGVSATTAVTTAAYEPTFMHVFDPLITNVVHTLRDTVYTPWIAVGLAAVGVLLLWRARSAKISAATKAVGWALFVMFLAAAVFSYPTAAGHTADEAVGSVLGAVDLNINHDPGDTPAQAAAQNLYGSVLWEQWKLGEFGSANSQTANKYAAQLFDAQSFTWAEADVVEHGSFNEVGQLYGEKADEWDSTTDAIKGEDPDAYQYVTGHNGSSRFEAAIVANIAALCTMPLLFMSAVLILAALVIVRMTVMMLPAIATIGVVDAASGLVKGAANTALAALINCVVFGIGARINLMGLSVLLDPNSQIPTWLGLTLALLMAVVMWMALKPFRRLTHMVSPNRSMLADAGDAIRSKGTQAMGYAKTGAAAAVGGAVGAKVAADSLENAADDGEASPRSETFTAPDTSPAPTSPPPVTATPAELPAAPEPPPAAVTAHVSTGAGAPPPPNAIPVHVTYDGNSPAVPDEQATAPVQPSAGAVQPTVREPVSTVPGGMDEGPVFVPGESRPEDPGQTLRFTEPELDDNGDPVYSIFNPDETGDDE